MGGVGKTTLAQLLCNNVKVKNRFHLETWVYLFEDFDVFRITKTMLQSISTEAVRDNDLNLLQLKKWSDDDCLCVFTQRSSRRTDFNMHMHLKEIGEKIVKKCNGLPLASEILGGLLHGKVDCIDWEDVLNSKAISCHYLLPHLKRCFSYCSIFPEDCKFEEEELILLRMAQGFLRHENSEKPVEQLGHQYSGELQSRSHFRQSSSNVSRFAMHDFINDLAHKYDGIKRFEAIDGVKHLRTSLPISSRVVWDYSHLNRNVLFDLSLKLQCFRYELPSEIGDLKILRYLNFSDAQVETSPESVCKLHNLETLKLQNCNRLQKLFADIGNLNNLHHLDNFVTFSLESLESL
ncbi:hypothetical protein CISIN_1g043181mg, partial [Citrus sinensis]